VQAVKGNRPLSAWSAGQTVRILIPPANLRSTDTGFAWDAVPTAVSYTYELLNSLTQAVLYSKTQVGTSFTPPAPLGPGQYTLRVYASFFGSSSKWTSLAYEIFQPTTVSITSSNAATADATPTITWGPVAGAVTYEVVVTRAGITAPVYDRLNIVGPSHRVDRILSPGTYQIQVRAIFADGSRSALSAKQQLVIGPAPVVSFSNGVLNWNSINGASHYKLWVNYLGTPVKAKIVYQPNTLQTSYTLPGTLPKGQYRAWVRAVRSEGGAQYAGLWSIALNFDIL
jgi:predicted phage tail protein